MFLDFEKLSAAADSAYLWDNFRGRVEKKTVKTCRYLWHVTKRSQDKDLSIAAEGLLCEENYAVFAHNYVQEYDAVFPYVFMMKFMDEKFYDLAGLSFWRIDTTKFKADWYIDPNMELDLYRVQRVKCRPSNYLCAFSSVPSSALKLFHVSYDLFHQVEPVINRHDGVASVVMPRRDFDTLRPVKKINDFIQWRNAKAITNFFKTHSHENDRNA